MTRTRIILIGMLGFALALLIALTGAEPTVTADNRVNCHAASPVIIYCDDDGIMVRSIVGQELLKISDEVLETAVLPEEGNATLLGEGNNLWAYLLNNGQYLVAYFNAERSEWFLVFWEGCGAGTAGSGDIKVYTADFKTLISDADGCGIDGGEEECSLICDEDYDDCVAEMGVEFCQEILCYDSCVGPQCDCEGEFPPYCFDICEFEFRAEVSDLE